MRRVLISLGLVLALAVSASVSQAQDAQPLKVCLISGSEEYKSDETLSEFRAFLEANYPAQSILLKATSVSDLPGLEALESCDVALFYTRRLTIEGEQLDRIKAYVLSGRPLVGVRTASHGFQNWLEMDKLVFGGNYQGHLSNDLKTEVSLVPGMAAHPAVKQFEDFTSNGSLYKASPLAPDCQVLLMGVSPEGTEPIAWTRNFQGARIFYTSLGHPDDFEHEGFCRMLADALFWTARRATD